MIAVFCFLTAAVKTKAKNDDFLTLFRVPFNVSCPRIPMKRIAHRLCLALFTFVSLPALLTRSAGPQAGTAATSAEIQAVKAKLNLAVPYFKRTWSHILALQGLHFDPPVVITYRDAINTGCGQMKSGNAYYCRNDKRVYLDVDLLASLVRLTAGYTHTDGDYASIIVAAHEIGHAVHQQLPTAQMGSFNEEQTADCFAGAVTNQARIDGYLEPGDLAEGRYSLLISSDVSPFPGLVGRLYVESQPKAHGTASQRILAFNRGYYAGAAACVGELGIATPPPGGRILFHETFQAPPGAQPTSKTACSFRPAIGGVLVTDIAFQNNDPCNLTVMNFGTIPDHVRLEATLRLQSGPPKNHVGIFFGPPHTVGGSFEDYYIAFVQADGGYGLYERTTLSYLVSSSFRPPLAAKGYGALNRITVDIHREQSDATILLYINGKFAGIAMPLFGWVDRSKNHNEQAGPYLQTPGMQAVFNDFRVVALPEDR
jgi:predicted metalloprotease